ncbi:unnamed protein product, partial [Brassica rapa]
VHRLVSYRRFGRARSLCSDRTERTLGRYVATELGSSSVATFIRKNQFRKGICRRKFSSSSSDVLNVNFVVTVFDSNKLFI